MLCYSRFHCWCAALVLGEPDTKPNLMIPVVVESDCCFFLSSFYESCWVALRPPSSSSLPGLRCSYWYTQCLWIYIAHTVDNRNGMSFTVS